jgi:hypothetical protein
MLEHSKIDYSSIETHIRRARLERSVALGEAIADSIQAIWVALKRAGHFLKTQFETVMKTPHSYSTSLRRL